MVERPRIEEKAQIAEKKILCFLHFRYANSEDVIFTRKELNKQIRGINPRIINFALESLVIDKRVDTEDVEEEGIYVTGHMISRAGIAWVESLHDDEYEEISQEIEFLDSEQPVPTNPQVVESSQIAWEPLPINRESPTFREAENAVENAISEIEGNNGYAETEPEERNHIVASLKDGFKQFREGLPSRDQLVAYLLSPLRFIAKKFADAAMGISAKEAVEKLLTWLGSL